MRKVFLETHNLKNMASGFGIFNYELVKAFRKLDTSDLEITLNVKHPQKYKNEFQTDFKYNLYTPLQRQDWWGVFGNYDVWHCMNQNIRIEPFFKPKKYVLTVHDVNFAEDVQNKKNIGRAKRFQKKLKRADIITYISNYAKEQTHKYFTVPKIEEHIIYNGNPITEELDTSSFQADFSVDSPYFYSIGDFLEKKNFESIVQMMTLLPDFNLIISGNNQKPYGDKIKNLVKELNLENRVFLTGRVSEQAKQFYMKNCEAFLFPSIGEGFGLPPIEAMRFGKPVFLSNLASLPEVGGDAAFYWDNFDPNYMKELVMEKLDLVQNNLEYYRTLSKERAAYFSWDTAAKAYLEIYRS